jgi:uncharacterized SAM-binding protein YcdF (DUF218 family)
MIRRVLSILVLTYAIGFAWFAVALPQPAGSRKTDAIVVLTGGGGRIGRGLEALTKGWARQMLVSGVDREVRPHEFALQYKVPARLMQCCVTLGFESVDTRSNADETARWIARNRIKSVRLVTTDWHMRRAAYELQRSVPGDVTIVRDAVPSRPRLSALFLEYHKLIARRLAVLWGD